MRAATSSASVATGEGKLWIRKQNPYTPATIEAATDGNPSAESICVEAIHIPYLLEKAVQPLVLNISSKGYYVDAIAEKLGVADASHVLLSRCVELINYSNILWLVYIYDLSNYWWAPTIK